ncbi:MAG: hypothetical protein GX638_17175 [Crenarchaeota archaeon]|nr:hypothetical protein [Thermoproteota archaeon]
MNEAKKPKLRYIAHQDTSDTAEDKRLLAEFINIIVIAGYREMKKQEKILKFKN